MRILQRCYIALRLVEYKVYVLLALKLLIVETYLIGGENLCAKLSNYLTINGYYASKDKVIGLAT